MTVWNRCRVFVSERECNSHTCRDSSPPPRRSFLRFFLCRGFDPRCFVFACILLARFLTRVPEALVLRRWPLLPKGRFKKPKPNREAAESQTGCLCLNGHVSDSEITQHAVPHDNLSEQKQRSCLLFPQPVVLIFQLYLFCSKTPL